ncbi:hypothetical protein HPB47_006463 [Ixodes persulcatus]|uniref:Uncharacterized protein n=1 Tax=Ixodes persulcatus TaxID=34615 RepID=A0AC60PAA4_IXOPE|nr:hypothetical protein HPB47_006463 [Ixodes persulcatus]
MKNACKEVGWTKPDPATSTKRKLTSVVTNRHSSGTHQHLDMDDEGRRRSQRNRIRQTAASGPLRLPATVGTGTGSTSLGGSDDATTSQDGVAGQDSERSDTDTVGRSSCSKYLADGWRWLLISGIVLTPGYLLDPLLGDLEEGSDVND